MNKITLGLITLLLISCKEEIKQPEVVKENKTETIEASKPIANSFSIKGDYTKASYNKSSDIALTNNAGNKLFLYTKNSPTLITQTNNVGNNFAWSRNGKKIIFKEKTPDYKTKIISIDPNTLQRTELTNLPDLTAIKALSVSDTVYYLDRKTLGVKAIYENHTWDISSEKGNYYNIEVSPNNKYLIAHKGSFIYLFTTKGEFIKKLGKGIATSWHPNSKYIIGFLDSSDDGHEITGSDLLLFHINKPTVKINSSQSEILTWPSFKNENEIIYRDEVRNGIFEKNIETLIK